MRRRKQTRRLAANESELLEQTRIVIEISRQVMRETNKVLAENKVLRKKLANLLRYSN